MNAFAKDPLISVDDTNVTGDVTLNNADKAEQILDSMEKRYEEEGDRRVMPDFISYSTVINAHANSNSPECGIRADSILRRMTNRYLLGDAKCRPNAIAFTAAIKAHSASINATISAHEGGESTGESKDCTKQQIEVSARRCEDLLQQLCLMYQSYGNDRSLKPTSVTFELAIRALTQAEDWNGAERANMLRSEMIDVGKVNRPG